MLESGLHDEAFLDGLWLRLLIEDTPNVAIASIVDLLLYAWEIGVTMCFQDLLAFETALYCYPMIDSIK